MPNSRTLRLSFSSGEISPLMYERMDIDKVSNALATCLNAVVTPQGPVMSRRGMAFVAAIGNQAAYARLLAFNFSAAQNFVIVVTAGTFRFYANGAVLLAGSPAAYSAGTAYVVGGLVSSGGVNYYCIQAGTGHAPASSPAFWYAMPATGEYEIPNPYQQADLATIHYVQSGDIITLVHPNYAPMALQRLGNTDWVLSTLAFQSAYAAPTGVGAVATKPNATLLESFAYQVTTLNKLGLQESLPSTASTAVTNDLTISGDFNTVSWTAAVPPAGLTIGAYNVYKSVNGGAFGYVGQVPFGVK